MTYDNEVGASSAQQLGTTGSSSLSAMFDSRDDAQRAVDRLVQAGIPMTHIRMVSGGSDMPADGTGQGKSFWDTLGDFFFPEEDRHAYAEGLSRGGYLVTVTGLGAAHHDIALDILDDEGSINLDERAESWRSEGWGGYEPRDEGRAAGGASGTASIAPVTPGAAQGMSQGYAAAAGETDEQTIPVVEERLRLGKRDTSHGRVRVRAYTIEEPVSESIDLREERVEIERRPVDRAVTGSEDAFRDRTLEAEEYREEAVVQKEARVVEEIGLRKTSQTHHETVSDTVRRTEVEIDDQRDTLADARGDRGGRPV